MNKRGKIGAIIFGVIGVIGLIYAWMCSVIVPAGYVAVQYNLNGGISGKTLDNGFHFISPTVKTTLYTIGIEQSYLTSENKGDSEKDESFTASSSEGKAVTIDLTFTYQYPQEYVADVFKHFKGRSGEQVRDTFIKPNIVSWSKEVIARYKTSDMLGEKRSEVNIALTEYLSSRFKEYGININNVSLINIDVDEKTREAINAKITAQQNAETQEINNRTAIEKAEADAQVKIKQAEAEASAKEIAANAEAKANKEIAKSLTPELIEKIKYERWNGQVPQVQGDSKPIVNVQK